MMGRSRRHRGAHLRLQRLSAGLLINFNVHTLLPGLRSILR